MHTVGGDQTAVTAGHDVTGIDASHDDNAVDDSDSSVRSSVLAACRIATTTLSTQTATTPHVDTRRRRQHVGLF
jgi:hypothetical protein